MPFGVTQVNKIHSHNFHYLLSNLVNFQLIRQRQLPITEVRRWTDCESQPVMSREISRDFLWELVGSLPKPQTKAQPFPDDISGESE